MSRGFDLEPFLMTARDRLAEAQSLTLPRPRPRPRRGRGWLRAILIAAAVLMTATAVSECTQVAARHQGDAVDWEPA